MLRVLFSCLTSSGRRSWASIREKSFGHEIEDSWLNQAWKCFDDRQSQQRALAFLHSIFLPHEQKPQQSSVAAHKESESSILCSSSLALSESRRLLGVSSCVANGSSWSGRMWTVARVVLKLLMNWRKY